MTERIVCLSPFDPEAIRQSIGNPPGVEVVTAPRGAGPEALRELLAGADLVIGDRLHQHRIGRPELAVMKRCRLVHQPAVGFDTIDHVAAAELGIPVTNSAGYNSEAVADWTVMAMLVLLRQAARVDREVRAGRWPLEQSVGRELGALTIGVIGLGHAGAPVAQRVMAFGAGVVFSEVVDRELPGATRLTREELLHASDIVTLHVPLNANTRGMIGKSAFETMRPGSYLVNASRGPVVNQAALVDALRAGQLTGAALDVFEEEPLPPGSPLRQLDNVLLSPHVAGLTHEAEERLLEVTGSNLRRVLEGRAPVNVVNGV